MVLIRNAKVCIIMFILQVKHLVLNGQPLGHCVACNILVCNATQHVASLPHQKHYNEIKKSSVIVDTCTSENPRDTTETYQNPNKNATSQQTTKSATKSAILVSHCERENRDLTTETLQDYIESAISQQDTISATESARKKLGIDNRRDTTKKLQDLICLKNINGMSQQTTKTETELARLPTQIEPEAMVIYNHRSTTETSQDSNKNDMTQATTQSETEPVRKNMKNLDIDSKTVTTANEKLGYKTANSSISFFLNTSSTSRLNGQIEEPTVEHDLIEVRTENGVMLAIPQSHFNGIRVSSICENDPESAASALRCMLCKERGMTEALVHAHVNSSTHADFVRKLVMDKHGIRRVS